MRYQPPDVCAGMPKGQLSPTCLKNGDPADDNTSGATPVAAASYTLLCLAIVLLSMIAK